MQQVTIATGAVVSSDIVVTEMITEHIFISVVAAFVYIWTDEGEESDDEMTQLFLQSLTLLLQLCSDLELETVTDCCYGQVEMQQLKTTGCHLYYY